MKQYTVAIVGATGAVGTQMLQCLEEQEFPVGELKLLASPRSAGKKVETPWGEVVIEAAAPECFDGVDIVLGAAEDDVAKALYPEAVRRGAVVVDNSHAFRLDEGVPLVVPEINAGDIASHHGIIANPNCATIIGLVPTWPLHQLAGVKRMIVSTYQAASGAGMPGMLELEAQIGAMGRGEEMPTPRAFAAQLASNLIPQIGGEKFEGFTSEEMKLQNEGRKIMHLPELRVNCTCVRVPVLRSHSESITLEFERDITLEQAREALAAFVRNDAVLLSEAACWAEEARDVCGEMISGGLGALSGSPEAAAFAEVSDALAALARLHPFGVEDHELVSISV